MKTTNWILTTAVVSVGALAAVASHTATHAQQEDLVMPSTDSVTDDATFAALAELPDEEPLIMLNLLEYTDAGETYAKYGRVALPQIEKRGGRILYSGTPLADDSSAGHWDRVVIVYYPNRAAFLDMMADPDYREGLPHRTAGLKRTVLYAFTQRKDPAAPPLEPVPIQGGEEIFVLNLLRFNPNGGREEYGKYGRVVLPMLQERGGSRMLILDGQLPLVSEEAWEDLYLVRYPTLEALQGMVATEAWQTANEDRQRGLDLTWAFPTRP